MAVWKKLITVMTVFLIAGCSKNTEKEAELFGETKSLNATGFCRTEAERDTDILEIEKELSWERARHIEAAICQPVFPDYTVSICDFGAVADDGMSDTEAVRSAIEKVSNAGGGTVLIPSGTFETGAVELKTGVNLNLSKPDSVLRFSKEIVHENYPLVLTYYEGIACYNWSPLIYAYHQENIGITGPGRLDGQADENTWWSWYGNVGVGMDFSRPSSSDVTLLRKMNDEGEDVRKRIFGEGHYLRPNFIQMIGCRNILIEGVTVENSPMWGIHPVLCTSVTIRGVTIQGKWNNNDGCNPENSRLVLIEDCCFRTGGDGISVKAGRGRDGWILKEKGHSSKDILIRNNEFCSGSSGIAFGSEMSGGICDVYAEGNRFGTESLDYGIRLKSNGSRGGVIEKIYIKDSVMEHIRNVAVHGTVYYGEEWNDTKIPEFSKIRIENMTGTGGEYGIFIEAYPELPVKNLQLISIHLEQAGEEIRAINWDNPVMEDVVLNGKPYPRPMNVKITGIPAPNHQVEGHAEILGGREERLSYQWILRRKSGEEILAGQSKTLYITDEMAGSMMTLWVEDEHGNREKSMEYQVLTKETDQKFLSDTVKYVLTRGYVEEESLDLDKPVSNRDCGKVLYQFWKPQESVPLPDIQDLPKTDPDYSEIADVIKGGYMCLKRQNGEMKEDVVFQNTEENETLFFEPDRWMTRGELGQTALLACGIPYEEMMSLEPDFEDSGEIPPQYRSSVGVSAKFGFVKAKEDNFYRPKEVVTWRDFLNTLRAISEFNNR